MNTPLYRFFNVVLFLLYSIVVLISFIFLLALYGNRPVASATVLCKDGTKWNVSTIYDDDAALCGICTQRSNNGNYETCSYGSINYSAYTVNKTYGWSSGIIGWPLVMLGVGFAIVDAIKIAVIYIFSGGINISSSLLLRILSFFFSGNKKTS